MKPEDYPDLIQDEDLPMYVRLHTDAETEVAFPIEDPDRVYGSTLLQKSNFRLFMKGMKDEWDDQWRMEKGFVILSIGTPACDYAQEFAASLKDYPCRDEVDYSELQTEEADEDWDNQTETAVMFEIMRHYGGEFDTCEDEPDVKKYYRLETIDDLCRYVLDKSLLPSKEEFIAQLTTWEDEEE